MSTDNKTQKVSESKVVLKAKDSKNKDKKIEVSIERANTILNIPNTQWEIADDKKFEFKGNEVVNKK